MNLDETDEQYQARSAMAASLRRLGHTLVGHRIDADLAWRIAAVADELAGVAATGQVRDRLAEVTASERFSGADHPGPANVDPDGGVLDLMHDSIVSGQANPMSLGVVMRRRGDAVEAGVTFGPAHEGAPRRAHGGAVAAVVDEAMGFALALIGEVAYTANLNIDFVGPTPVGQAVTITARVRDRAGRKIWIEATGEGPDGVFVRAEALFLSIDLTRFRLET
jgi:acyl-coenzyme A thioesterase PaaI-like protein